MTCRNYIPGPIDWLPIDEAYEAANEHRCTCGEGEQEEISCPHCSRWEKARAMLQRALQNTEGDCQRCGEMRAGHAGSECAGPFVDTRDCPVHRQDTQMSATTLTDAKCPYCVNGLVTLDSGRSVNCGHLEKANQCDGCRRGLPLRGNGIHYEDKPFAEAMPVMACEKDMRAGHAGSEKRMTDDPRKLREQIGYLIGMLHLRGDPRSLPEILDEVERATEDK